MNRCSSFTIRWYSQSVSLSEVVDKVYSDPNEAPFVKQLPSNQQLYYFERGSRLVYPYFHILQSYCLGAWAGKYVCEVYFKDKIKPPKYIQSQIIERGFIRVNKKIVSPNYVMQFGDVLSHVIHFHESPIIDLPFKIIHNDEIFIVVDKPPGIPMHAAGKYNHNSLHSIVRAQCGDAFGFNRIDAVTSGLIILVKSSEKVAEMAALMRNRKISKEYICEVEGNFPHDEISVDVPLIRCCNKTGPVIVDKHSGLPSVTLIKKVKFNHSKGTSILNCFPLTGRTHQIRVHLQYLGFPIINDNIYNTSSFGPKGGKNGDYCGLTDAEIFSNVYMENQRQLEYIRDDSVDCIDEYELFYQNYRTDEWVDYTHEHRYKSELDSYCPECHICQLVDREPPARSKQFLHLHALRYKGPDWQFTAQPPYWAR